MQHIWTTHDLRRRGWSPRRISKAAGDGSLPRIRPGWYCEKDAPVDIVRAVRLGGLATAHTAARSLGLWTPPDGFESTVRHRTDPVDVLHVAVPANASFSALRDPDTGLAPYVPRVDVVLHWSDPSLLRSTGGTGRVDLMVMLQHLFLAEVPERALAVLDSALHHRHLRVRDLHALAARLPGHLRPVVFAADPRAESGIESVVRWRLLQLDLPFDLQVRISGVGTVDLLVDGRLIIECDGRLWHDDEDAFRRDRTRDLVSTTGRYRTLRLTWHRVLFQWPSVEAAILAALA